MASAVLFFWGILLGSILVLQAILRGKYPRHVTLPLQYRDALQRAISAHPSSCGYNPTTVSKTVYGTLSSFNTATLTSSEYFDGRGVDFAQDGIAIAWFSNYVTLEMFLNSHTFGCCGVKTMQRCFLNIAVDVGVLSSGQDVPIGTAYEYIAVSGAFNNESNSVQGKLPFLNLLQPNWNNLLDTYNTTFASVFSSVPSYNPSCAVSDAVRTRLSASGGVEGWEALFREYEADFAKLNCTVLGCHKTELGNFVSQPADDVCDQVAAARAYLFKFLDANTEYLGTGSDPSGPEFIAIPNLPVRNALDAAVLQI